MKTSAFMPVIPPSPLTDLLELDDLVRETDSLSAVGLRGRHETQGSSKVSDLLLVDSGDGQVDVARDGGIDASWELDDQVVRVAHGQDELAAVHLATVSDSDLQGVW